MMLTEDQHFAIRCLEAQDYRLTVMMTGPRILVFVDDYLFLMNMDGSLGPEVD